MSTEQRAAIPPIVWVVSIAFLVGMFLWSHGVSEHLLWARIPGAILQGGAFIIVAVQALER